MTTHTIENPPEYPPGLVHKLDGPHEIDVDNAADIIDYGQWMKIAPTAWLRGYLFEDEFPVTRGGEEEIVILRLTSEFQALDSPEVEIDPEVDLDIERYSLVLQWGILRLGEQALSRMAERYLEKDVSPAVSAIITDAIEGTLHRVSMNDKLYRAVMAKLLAANEIQPVTTGLNMLLAKEDLLGALDNFPQHRETVTTRLIEVSTVEQLSELEGSDDVGQLSSAVARREWLNESGATRKSALARLVLRIANRTVRLEVIAQTDDLEILREQLCDSPAGENEAILERIYSLQGTMFSETPFDPDQFVLDAAPDFIKITANEKLTNWIHKFVRNVITLQKAADLEVPDRHDLVRNIGHRYNASFQNGDFQSVEDSERFKLERSILNILKSDKSEDSLHVAWLIAGITTSPKNFEIAAFRTMHTLMELATLTLAQRAHGILGGRAINKFDSDVHKRFPLDQSINLYLASVTHDEGVQLDLLRRKDATFATLMLANRTLQQGLLFRLSAGAFPNVGTENESEALRQWRAGRTKSTDAGIAVSNPGSPETLALVLGMVSASAPSNT